MKKTTKKTSHKEKAPSVPKKKKIIKHQKEPQVKVPKAPKPAAVAVEVKKAKLLDANQIRKSLSNLAGWQANTDHKMIYREFILLDFMAAIDLVHHIAKIAEEEKHHPDMHLTQYRNLRVGITTHEVGGLSEKDFIVAKKINDLPVVLKRK